MTYGANNANIIQNKMQQTLKKAGKLIIPFIALSSCVCAKCGEKIINNKSDAFIHICKEFKSDVEFAKNETEVILGDIKKEQCDKILKDLSILAEEQMENKAVDDFIKYYSKNK